MDKIVNVKDISLSKKKKGIKKYPDPIIRPKLPTQADLRDGTPVEERTAKNGWCTFN